MMSQRSIISLVILSIGFCFAVNCLSGTVVLEQTIVEQVYNETHPMGLAMGSGYISLSIVYATFTLFNFVAPNIVQLFGPKYSLMFGAVAFALFSASFIRINAMIIYAASVMQGLGSAVIWTAQGKYISLISTPDQVGTYSSIAWAIMQVRVSSLFIYLFLMGRPRISGFDQMVTFGSLTGCGVAALLMFCFLANKKQIVDLDDSVDGMCSPILYDASDSGTHESSVDYSAERNEQLKNSVSAKSIFLRTFQLLANRDMQLLVVVFIYGGFHLGFYSGVYPTCISNTKHLAIDSEALVGLHGIFISVGEVLGGVVFGIFGRRLVENSRQPVLLLGFLVSLLSYYLIFLNIPYISPLRPNEGVGFVQSNEYLALTCSFLLGLADSCWNTQIYSVLCYVFTGTDTAAAFALFKFFQSMSTAISFAYSTSAMLYIHLGVLTFFCFIAVIAFMQVEWNIQRRRLLRIDSFYIET